MSPRLSGLGIAATLLVGCSVHAPETPVTVVMPDTWTAVEPVERALISPGEEWWTTFGDARLDRLVEAALLSNHDLRAATHRVEQADALARIAGADLAPMVGLGVDSSRSRQNFVGLPIPGSESGVLSNISTSHRLALNVSWEIDLWGRLRASQQAAIARLEASQADLDAARLSLAGQTAKAWFAFLEASQQLQLAEDTLQIRTVTREQIRRRYDLGLRTPLELRLALSNEAVAEATLADRSRRLDVSRRRLQVLVAEYPNGELEGAPETAVLPDRPGPIPAGRPTDILLRRPDLQAAETRLAARGFSIHQARAALYPQLRLTGSAGTLSDEVSDLLDTDFSIWSLGASLLQPIFQGGRLRAGVDLAEARYSEAAEGYAQTVIRALSEVESLLAGEGLLAAQELSLAMAAEQSVAAQRLAEDRYSAGLSGYLEVLESQREAFRAQGAHIATRRALLDSRVDLHLALGGGADTAAPASSADSQVAATGAGR